MSDDSMPSPETPHSLTLNEAGLILSAWRGEATACRAIDRLEGGMIHTVLALRFDSPPGSAVAKISPHASHPLFATECEQLRYLKRHASFPCPEVYALDLSRDMVPFSYLLLETLPGIHLGLVDPPMSERAALERQMAAILLDLHSHRRDAFGSVGEGARSKRWSDLFVPRLREMREKIRDRIETSILENIDFALEVVHDALDRSPEQPALVHGDIWAGNILVAEKGNEGWRITGLVDPGAEYADRECELAYLQIFRTMGEEFLSAYSEGNPLDHGYRHRRLFYWLNTAMIHVAIFGEARYHRLTARVAQAIREVYGKGAG